MKICIEYKLIFNTNLRCHFIEFSKNELKIWRMLGKLLQYIQVHDTFKENKPRKLFFILKYPNRILFPKTFEIYL